jgi:hypothetical protein
MKILLLLLLLLLLIMLKYVLFDAVGIVGLMVFQPARAY